MTGRLANRSRARRAPRQHGSHKGPLRAIVDHELNKNGVLVEVLECGHRQHPVSDLIGETNAARRRCWQCRKAAEAAAAAEVEKEKMSDEQQPMTVNAAELYFEDGKPAGVFYCRECKAVYKTHDGADVCCRPRVCACGAETRKLWLKCEVCIRKERIETQLAVHAKATKVGQADYKGNLVYLEWEGKYVFTDDLDDHLFTDLEEHIADGESREDWEPPLVYATTEIQPGFDAERMIEHATEESYEDALDDVSAKSIKELQDLLDVWAGEHLPVHYYVDYNVALIIGVPEEPTYDESPEDGVEEEIGPDILASLARTQHAFYDWVREEFRLAGVQIDRDVADDDCGRILYVFGARRLDVAVDVETPDTVVVSPGDGAPTEIPMQELRAWLTAWRLESESGEPAGPDVPTPKDD